jgi:hypothetical protein
VVGEKRRIFPRDRRLFERIIRNQDEGFPVQSESQSVQLDSELRKAQAKPSNLTLWSASNAFLKSGLKPQGVPYQA